MNKKYEKVMEVALINIVAHPHIEGTYSEILRHIAKLRRPQRIHGNRYALITRFEIGLSPKDHGLYGVLATFDQIDPNQPWIDVPTGSQVDDEEKRQIELALGTKRPNMAEFLFRLDPLKHKISIQTKSGDASLTPSLASKYFALAVQHPEIVERFGEVAVTLVSDAGLLGQIFTMKNIRSLEVVIKIPNPDGHGTTEDDVREEMERRRVKMKRTELVAKRNEFIQFDDELRAEAEVARTNGYVLAKRKKKEGGQISTRNYPQLEILEYNARELDDKDAFVEAARRQTQS